MSEDAKVGEPITEIETLEVDESLAINTRKEKKHQISLNLKPYIRPNRTIKQS